MSTQTQYPDRFDELKAQVRQAGLLDRVPVRGTVEMIAVLASIIATLVTAPLWNPVLLGLFWAQPAVPRRSVAGCPAAGPHICRSRRRPW